MGRSTGQARGTIGRREALRLAGRGGLAAAGLGLLGRCKGTTTPEPEPPPVQVTVLVKFYNHTQGYIGEKEFSGLSGTPLIVKVADCPDISTVDPDRIAVREAANGGWLGKFIGYTKSGLLTGAKFPGQNMTYDAFLMNRTHGAEYGLVDSYPGDYAGTMLHSPQPTWWRDDDASCVGPDEVPHQAMQQISEALIYPWAKYMEIHEVPTNGEFFVGYLCPPPAVPAANWRGYAHEFAAWVNPNLCQSQGHPIFRVFLEQLFKHLTGCIGAGGAVEVAPPGTLTYQYMTDETSLNAIGKDLLAYIPVKSPKYVPA